jgi:hypothetical protein
MGLGGFQIGTNHHIWPENVRFWTTVKINSLNIVH